MVARVAMVAMVATLLGNIPVIGLIKAVMVVAAATAVMDSTAVLAVTVVKEAIPMLTKVAKKIFGESKIGFMEPAATVVMVATAVMLYKEFCFKERSKSEKSVALEQLESVAKQESVAQKMIAIIPRKVIPVMKECGAL